MGIEFPYQLEILSNAEERFEYFNLTTHKEVKYFPAINIPCGCIGVSKVKRGAEVCLRSPAPAPVLNVECCQSSKYLPQIQQTLIRRIIP